MLKFLYLNKYTNSIALFQIVVEFFRFSSLQTRYLPSPEIGSYSGPTKQMLQFAKNRNQTTCIRGYDKLYFKQLFYATLINVSKKTAIEYKATSDFKSYTIKVTIMETPAQCCQRFCPNLSLKTVLNEMLVLYMFLYSKFSE